MKKKLFIKDTLKIITTVVLFSLLNLSALAIDYKVSDSISAKENYLLTDDKRSTQIELKEGDFITIEGKDIKLIYLKWDKYPKEGIVKEDSIIKEINSGFLHEALNTQNNGKIVIKVCSDSILNDVICFGDEIPQTVQFWQQNDSKADALIMSTHADDEHLYLGGAMATLANKENFSVQVAYMVNHNDQPWRNHELLNGLWEAGIKRYPVIPDFPDVYCPDYDYAKKVYDENEILEYQKQLLNKYSPQIAVAQDLKGEYGHGAHILNSQSMVKATEGSSVKKLYLHLYKENEIIIDDTVPIDEQGRNAFQISVDSFAHHKSQQEFFKVENSGIYDMRKFGLYYSAVGKDENNDMTENIVSYYEQEQQLKQQQEEEKSFQQEKEQTVEKKEEILPDASNDKIFALMITKSELFGIILVSIAVVLAFTIFYIGRRKVDRKK